MGRFSFKSWLGIVRAYTKYRALFTHSPLGMRIIDHAYNSTLSSASAVHVDLDTLQRIIETSPGPTKYDENTLLFSAPIVGGHAVWQEDISGINQMQREIEESVVKLKATNEMLATEERIKRAAQEENEKTQLMSQLEAEIIGHVIRLSVMIEQLEAIADQQKAMARITLLLCYIKRRCNLFFREKEAGELSANELTTYFDELAEMVNYADVKTIMTSALTSDVTIRRATLFYDFFYSAIHWATWIEQPRVLVHLGIEKGNIVLRILPSEDARVFQIDRSLEKSIAATGGTWSAKDLDGATGLSLSFPAGGESNV